MPDPLNKLLTSKLGNEGVDAAVEVTDDERLGVVDADEIDEFVPLVDFRFSEEFEALLFAFEGGCCAEMLPNDWTCRVSDFDG